MIMVIIIPYNNNGYNDSNNNNVYNDNNIW